MVSTTIERTVRVETRQRQPMPPRERLERIFDIEDLTASYGTPAIESSSWCKAP